MAEQGIPSVMNTGSILRLLLGAIFFSADVTHVIKELQNRDDLRRLAHIDLIPPDRGGASVGRIDEAQFVALINVLLRTRCRKLKRRDTKMFIVNGSAIMLDQNRFKKRS